MIDGKYSYDSLAKEAGNRVFADKFENCYDYFYSALDVTPNDIGFWSSSASLKKMTVLLLSKRIFTGGGGRKGLYKYTSSDAAHIIVGDPLVESSVAITSFGKFGCPSISVLINLSNYEDVVGKTIVDSILKTLKENKSSQ